MDNIPGYIVVSFLGCLFAMFPGILFMRLLSLPGALQKITATIFISFGFWICSSWFISWAGLPLSYSTLGLLTAFIGWFCATYFAMRKKGAGLPISRAKNIAQHNIVLVIVLLLLSAPLFFITIPPGCDTAMHGYITRLIINNNGLPHSYRPILPVDYFGSYSAGYHMFTALVSGVRVIYLRQAINLVSIAVYPLTLLAMIFALSPFFSEKTAVYTSIIFFGINNTYTGTIWWGGNPSMLSFAFCLFSLGLVMHAVKERSAKTLYCSAFAVAAIPLVHAIPAITFVYLAVPGYCILLYCFRGQLKWLLLHSIVLVGCVVVLLLPFVIHFKNENSPELLLMIKNWQHDKMNNALTSSLPHNLLATAGQINNRVGDVITILSLASLLTLVYFKRYRVVFFIAIFMACTYLLILNSGYWVVPFSELLYPERVVYFMILCGAFSLGYVLAELEFKGYIPRIFKGRLSVYIVIVAVLLVVSVKSMVDQSLGLCKEDQVSCDRPTVAAFNWINAHTEPGALFVASYADAGMWIPTFTNRATLGTHMHFIHEIKHINDTLNASTAPRYFFITRRDIKEKKGVMAETQGRVLVFADDAVHIYH